MKEDAEILLKKAENDLKDAKILFKSNEASMEGICFHCQQSVEKYLKAFLVCNNKEIDFTHDIIAVLSDCRKIDIDFNKLKELNIGNLTNYAVIVRYDDIIELSAADAKEAINIAEQVKPFVIKKINELSPIIDHKQDIKNGPVPAEKEPIQTKPDISHSEVIKRKFRRQ